MNNNEELREIIGHLKYYACKNGNYEQLRELDELDKFLEDKVIISKNDVKFSVDKKCTILDTVEMTVNITGPNEKTFYSYNNCKTADERKQLDYLVEENLKKKLVYDWQVKGE